jgi:hypothetical protein
MDRIKALVKFIIGTLGVALLTLIAAELLPWPLLVINFPLVLFLLVFLLDREFYWPAILAAVIFLEPFCLSPFGVNSWSFLLTIIFSAWIGRVVITNRSLYSVLALGVIGSSIRQVLFFLVVTIINFFSRLPIYPWPPIGELLMEISLNTLALSILYYSLILVAKSLRPNYIRK